MHHILPSETAYERIAAALEAHGMIVKVSAGRARSTCPHPGHPRVDRDKLDVQVSPGRGQALMHCHAGCSTEDVLRAVRLRLADLYDDPRRKRPTKKELKRATDNGWRLGVTEKAVFLWLLDLADATTTLIPPKRQPGGQQEIARKIGIAPSTFERAFAHLRAHGWVTVTCRRKGCELPGVHRVRGHLPWWGIDLGQTCCGATCPHRGIRTGSQREIRTGSRYLSPEKYVPAPGKIDTGPSRVPAGQAPVSTGTYPREEQHPEQAPHLTAIPGGKSKHGKPGRPRNDSCRAEVLQMRAAGWPVDRIADTLGQPKATVWRITARAGYATERGLRYEDVHDCAVCKRPCHGPVRRCQRHGGAA